MRPSVVLLGFVLGTAASILFSLAGVAVIFLVLGSEYPRFRTEMGSLGVSLALFALLTLFAGLSFYGFLRVRPWRVAALIPTVVLLAVIGWYYWP